MADKLPTSPVRGTRDLLPAECALRDAALEVILRTYRSWGFQRIETPALEHLELLGSGQGGENEKLIFKLMKRGEKLDLSKPGLSEDDVADCGLRFDLTVPLARYYAEHQSELPLPFKAIQIGPVWRAERPQKGRYRQFTQCDIDVIGDGTAQAEVELILATCEALAAVGLSEFTVRISHRRLLGFMLSYAGVPAELHGAAVLILDKRDKLEKAALWQEIARLGVPEPRVQTLEALLDIAGSTHPTKLIAEWERELGQRVLDSAPDRTSHWPSKTDVMNALNEIELVRSRCASHMGPTCRIAIDVTLARGMGYYTGMIYEIGLQGLPYSIAGGGRYDKMIGRLQGRDVPACGFSIGFERLIALLQERGSTLGTDARRVAVVYDADAVAFDEAQSRADSLRAAGANVSLFAQKKKAGKQRADLEAQGYEIVTLPSAGDREP